MIKTRHSKRLWALVTAAILAAGCTAPQDTPPTAGSGPVPTDTSAETHTPAAASPEPSPTATATETATPTSTPTPTPTPTPVPSPRLNTAGHVGLGVYMDGVPYDQFTTVERFERQLWHKMQYVLWFQAWGNDDRTFQTDSVRLAAQKGWIPVITWEPWERNFENPTAPQPEFSLGSITAGDHDLYIRTWAREARQVGVPIIIRFAHEQSTPPDDILWYPWQGDPEAYKAAFRHIVTLFRDEGASNVQFLWSAMWLNEWGERYYPGDDIVDWVGTTVLNHGTEITESWAQWRTFHELFAAQYQTASQWGKPIMITELATAEQGGDKALWLQDCYAALQPQYPLVQGVLLLEVTSDREWPNINWSVTSSAESLAAFREAVRDPYFK